MNKNYYIIPIFVPHKGCPHDCIFCNQKRITGYIKDVTKEDVQKTINMYLSTINREKAYVELSFFGGSFTGIPFKYQNELLSAAKKALDEGKIDDIRLSTRPDYINEYILKNLKKYGTGVIELGVQSMDETVLKTAERGHTADDVIRSSNLIKEYGFKLGLQMMVGLPQDDERKDLYTADEIIKLKPDFVRIYPALVIKDTYMEYIYEKGLYKPLSIDEAVHICKKLYIKFYQNSIPIIRIGLQPTEQINLGRDIVAGPFHPAFRELVESSILNDMVNYLINRYYKESDAVYIDVSPADISKLYADKKRYFNNQKIEFNTKKIIVRQNRNVESLSLWLDNGEIKRKLSIDDYIKIVN